MQKNKDLLLDEWLQCEIKNAFHADCECAGLFLGMLRKNNNETFTSKRLITAHRLFMIKNNLWGKTNLCNSWEINFSLENVQKNIFFNASRKASCKSEKKSFTTELSELSEKISKSNRNYYWSWLHGIWGSAGNIYFPKNGYFLSITIPNVLTRNLAENILAKTNLSWLRRNNEFNLRNLEDIVTFLNNTGLVSAALKFEETAIFKSIRNHLNRTVNYENANIERSVKAALEQTKIAKKIIDNNLLDALPQKLKDLVILRLKYPEASLSELGKNLSPQIKKSAVKYRWLSLIKFIDKL